MYSDQFADDIDRAIDRASLNGINRILLPNIDLDSVGPMHDLVDAYPKICVPMMGLHPCSVKENYKEVLDELKSHFPNRKYCAVGEMGIDLHWDKSTLPWQQDAFKMQIEWAKELDLPIVIHARESFDEIFEIIDEVNDEKLRGVFHCFTGSLEQAQRVMAYGGFMMGIGGVITYKNSGLKETLVDVPLSHLMLETDSPYLAPVPFRGKRNESSYILQIAIELSKVYGRPIQEIADITSANATQLFRLDD